MDKKKKSHKTSLKNNFIYTIVFRLSTIIVPLVTTPYVSRVLGPDNSGIYSYTYTIAWYFVIFGLFGFENYGNRLIATVKDNQKELDKTFSSLFGLQLITASIAIAGYLVYMLFICNDYILESWLSGIYLISVLLNISWLFYGLEQFKTTALRTIAVRFLSLILIFIFVRGKESLWVYVFILAAMEVVSQVILWFHINKFVNLVRVSIKEVFSHLKGCFILFIPVVLIQIYRLANTLLLGILGTMDEVGFYTYADRITELPLHIITAIGLVMLPRTANLIARGEHKKTEEYMQKSLRYNMLLSSGIAFGMIAISTNFCILFLGKEYFPCGIMIAIMAPMLILRAVANVTRTQYLIPHHRDKEYIISLVVGVILNITLNLLLIPRIGVNGAALSTLIAESSVAITQILFTLKDLPIKQYIIPNMPFLLFGIIMCIIVILIQNTFQCNWGALLLLIMIGIFVYFIMSIAYLLKLNDELAVKCIKRLNLKFKFFKIDKVD